MRMEYIILFVFSQSVTLSAGQEGLFIEWKVEELLISIFPSISLHFHPRRHVVSFARCLTLTNYLFGARCSWFRRDVIFAHWTRRPQLFIAWTHTFILRASSCVYCTPPNHPPNHPHMPNTPFAFYCKSTKKCMFILFPCCTTIWVIPSPALAHITHNNPCLLAGGCFLCVCIIRTTETLCFMGAQIWYTHLNIEQTCSTTLLAKRIS